MRSGRPRCVYVPDALWEQLQAVLRQQGQSVSAWTREQAQRYVERQWVAGRSKREPASVEEPGA